MKYKNLIFDFDGVLAESNEIRFDGFRQLFEGYPESQVNQLVEYAKANGGVSRYEKIRYFFKEIRKKPIKEDKVHELSAKFSQLVKQKVVEAAPVKGSLEFLAQYNSDFNFAIASGSDQDELRDICKQRGIGGFFVEILGSPALKKDNIAALLSKFRWEKSDTVYIGDSLNDLEAAEANKIDFIARSSGLVDWSHTKVKFIPDLFAFQTMLV